MLTEELKKNTYPEHQASEKKMILALKSIMTLQDYVGLLNWLYGFYAPLETLIRKHLGADLLPDIDRRSRAEFLLDDMRNTGLPGPVSDICRELPQIESIPQAMGALYVLEGSTLGGRIIAGMVQRQLGEGTPTSYFNGYGEENTHMWETFKDSLDQPRPAEEQTAIIDGARTTFLTFKNWIDKHALQPQL